MDTIITDLTFLRQKSEEVKILEGLEVLDLFDRLEKVRHENRGFGLAAVQIGILKRAFVMLTPKGMVKMVNPTIIDKANPTLIPGEQCLSLPEKQCKTIRYLECQVTWIDPDTKQTKNAVFENIEAVIIQHEIDHLDGILMTDRIRQPIKRLGEKIGRNDPCFCGSGKKFKKCCLNKEVRDAE